MQQPLRRALIVIVALACLGTTPVIGWAEPGMLIGNGQVQPKEHVAEPPVDLQQQIALYVDKLAKQPGFELWNQARWDSYPLGPGIRGWVVILRKDGKECGYLIVNAAPDGTYKLGEYGTGSNPLFGVDALSQSLQSSELGDGVNNKVNSVKVERYYANPWHSVWSVTGQGESKLLDAATGDTLPIRWEEVNGEFASLGDIAGPNASDRIVQTLQTSAFDPYEQLNWLIDDPMPSPSLAKISSLVSSPDSMRLTFVSQPYNGQAIYAYAVSGAQQWETAGLFLRLSANGEDRYVPFSQMTELGHFYR